MAYHGPVSPDLAEKIKNAKVFVVGAGGIGCELLKGLVLTGYKNITIIDMDTIDMSNLNRQFLFQNKHIGQAKSKVARESVLQFVPDANIEAIVGSILSPEYGVEFFEQFQIILSALDNIQARRQVNAMAIRAEVPLVESGTAGYLGQVSCIFGGRTICYDCETKVEPRRYPVCTIHRTPSNIIHCIVWAKLVFNLLFGESNDDDETERANEETENGEDAAAEDETKSALKTLKEFARTKDFDPQALFDKIFDDDIRYLCSMDDLWKTRKPPTPVKWDEALATEDEQPDPKLSKEMQVWTRKQSLKMFEESLVVLKERFKKSNYETPMEWDKDDEPSLDFVTAVSNIRARIFCLEPIHRFEVKSKAGNIVPAIATANAIIAGAIVVESIKIINQDFDNAKEVILRDGTGGLGRSVLRAIEPSEPVSSCSTCSNANCPKIRLNLDSMTKEIFTKKILMGEFKMVEPEARFLPKGIFVSPDITIKAKESLSSAGLTHRTRVFCEDLENDTSICFSVIHGKDMPEDEYEVVSHTPEGEQNHNGNGVSSGSRKRIAEEQPETVRIKRKRITVAPEWIPDYTSDSDDDMELVYKMKKK